MKLLLGLASVIALASSAFAAGPEIGQPAPNFVLKDTTGKEVSLAEYKGKFVVLEWVNYGCPFVKKHYDSHSMQKLQADETAKGVVWLSICSSAPGKQGNFSPEDAAAMTKEYGSAATAYLLDSDGKVGALYDAKTTPDMYIINPAGNLIYKGAIDDQPSPDPSTLAVATNYVKLALSEAMADKPVSNPQTKSYGCSVKY
ncbi:thioredoxin family protein [soil metagenome]